MRRIGKVVLVAVACLAVLIVAAVAGVYGVSSSRLSKRHQVTPVPIGIPIAQGSLERGAHLYATRGCADCHGADLGGAKVVEDPAVGRLFGPNITKGQGSVTAQYRDEDWVRAIRHGVNPEGRPLVLMPSMEYAEFSDQDLADLLAFIQAAPGVDRATIPVEVGPISRVLLISGAAPLAADMINHTAIKPAVVTPGATPEYGRYLAVGCQGCHGPNLSGGKIAAGPPDWPPASNLTSHPQGAITAWSEADFLTALRTAHRPNGTEINPVMPRAFGKMHDDELKALYAYLKTVPEAETGVR
ncbi:MAG: c-type cytochrome [Chthoniobacteraceae bacterium]